MEAGQSINKAYLLTGGNMGNRAGHLGNAAEKIAACCGRIIRSSSLYETEAWGKTDQPNFLNQVLCIETTCGSGQLMKNILEIEATMGRIRKEKYGERIIDIDILFYNEEIIHEKGLIIPHPEIQNRRFVLTPMDEIAAGFIHPVLLKTIHLLLKECGDKLNVKKI